MFHLLVVSCSPLDIDNGMVVTQGGDRIIFGEGAVATYSCNPNFALMGVERRVCQANGTWSQTDPACVGKQIAGLNFS